MNMMQVGQAMRLMIAYVGEDCEEKRYEFTTREYDTERLRTSWYRLFGYGSVHLPLHIHTLLFEATTCSLYNNTTNPRW